MIISDIDLASWVGCDGSRHREEYLNQPVPKEMKEKKKVKVKAKENSKTKKTKKQKHKKKDKKNLTLHSQSKHHPLPKRTTTSDTP